jgi:hypothetical protein
VDSEVIRLATVRAYNHNVTDLPHPAGEDRWQLEANQLLIKVQYAWRL